MSRFREVVSREGATFSHKFANDLLDKQHKSRIPRKVRMSLIRNERQTKRLIEQRQEQRAQVIVSHAFDGSNITQSDASWMFKVLDRLERPFEDFSQYGEHNRVTIVDFSKPKSLNLPS